MAAPLVYEMPSVIEHSVRLAESFDRLTERSLVARSLSPQNLAKAIYELDAIVLSHDGGEDPVFTYANRAAQLLFEYDWATFLTLPSRLSAEPDHRDSRSAMLREAAAADVICNYAGVRISASGKRFQISEATIWTVTDSGGEKIGQAATFDRVQHLDSDLG